ncbi:MAG: hypothetical protein ACI8P0_001682, partial [Planctomycetaceae bacterium]
MSQVFVTISRAENFQFVEANARLFESDSDTNGTAGLVVRGYVMPRLRVRPGAGVVVSSSEPEPSVCVC